jgi:DNA polymerase III epsilon subunit-like protein
MESNIILENKDNYIKTDIIIENSHIHQITNKIIDKKGIKLSNVIEDFMTSYSNTDTLIGHNISFDIQMVLIELKRLFLKTNEIKWNDYYISLCVPNNNKIYCTMKNSIDICKISVLNKDGNSYFFKYPKLIELYSHLFSGKTPNNLHNALIDCFCCLRCYIKMKYHYDPVTKNKTFKELFNLIE